MDTVSYSGLRQNLAEYMDKVNGNHAPLLITRQNAPAAVLMSLADFKAYEETAYLMCSPVNAARLQDAVTQLEDNKGTLRVLIGE